MPIVQPGPERQANAVASDGVVIDQQHPDDGFRLHGLLRAEAQAQRRADAGPAILTSRARLLLREGHEVCRHLRTLRNAMRVQALYCGPNTSLRNAKST